MSGELRLSRTERTVIVADFSGLPLLWQLVVGRQLGSLLTMTTPHTGKQFLTGEPSTQETGGKPVRMPSPSLCHLNHQTQGIHTHVSHSKLECHHTSTNPEKFRVKTLGLECDRCYSDRVEAQYHSGER